MSKMKPYKRAVAVTGSYTDSNGDEKKRYTNIGTLFQYDDGGLSLKLDSIPVGDGWNGFVSFYDIEEKRDSNRSGGSSSSRGREDGFSGGRGAVDDFSDDVPFVTQWSLT